MFLNRGSRGLILALSFLFPLLFAWWDVSCHQHFNCNTLGAAVIEEYQSRSHLWKYMESYVDRNLLDNARDISYHEQTGTQNLESGIVKCVCSDNGKITLSGKVDNPDVRREFSDVALEIVGPYDIDNQIEVLNEPAIKELQALLSQEPNNMTMNYQIKDRGTVVLTGDLPNDDLGDHIDQMVRKIAGVRTVVNRLGERLEVPKVLRITNIYFDFNKWKIRPESQPRLDEAATWMTDYLGKRPNGKVRIEGHTDSIATDKYNDWLSQKRAEACLQALVDRGIPAGAMTAVGKGESELLISPDNTPEKRAENRRIEFHFE